ncbi:prephenate dehydratase [Sulfobacillus thermosulfidooxidans]|uniref:prephenate dehydratase n=1 Tax=Sulfobacillus thermosulfidooxidans TaxID=28034 RepID=UPI0002F9C776|nr:prephenate dehydratase domain-containing protein [Sulfobacillus thermosulfidooxidans]
MIDGTVVYYQGSPGAFSEAAILSHWPNAIPQGFPTFAETFQALQDNPNAVGLLPIENAYRGPVYDVLDLLTASTLSIWAEAVQPVELALMAYGHSDLSRIKKVRSHPQALMQSQMFCREHGLTVEVALDTAGSAKELLESRREDVGAIASPRAAEIYGLNIVRRGIQDHPDNRTRFWLLSQRPIHLTSPLNRMKTSAVFDLPDKPGALVNYLLWYKKFGLNLSKVESRPRPGAPFAYRFWIDVVGDAKSLDQAWESGLSDLEWFRRFGTYPVLSE